jgi:hypothetical protein
MRNYFNGRERLQRYIKIIEINNICGRLAHLVHFPYVCKNSVPGRPFQPSLMFARKDRNLHERSSFQVLHSWVGS